MRIPHPIPISFPSGGAHVKISSTCATIPTISLFLQSSKGLSELIVEQKKKWSKRKL
jgi:hypothetical protein